ncbi:unnamed protein product, partial [marine sediment metagenome]
RPEFALHPSTKLVMTNQTNGIYWVGVEYTFFIEIMTDPDGDKMYIFVDWGDGTDSGWLGPYTSGEIVGVTHFWTDTGTYEIKTKAKDEHGDESGWSDSLSISVIPPNRLFRDMEISGTLKTRPWRGLIFSILNFDCATVDKAISGNVQLDSFTCHNYKFVAIALNVHTYDKDTLFIEASTPFAILIDY